jgi:hypothetical protein
MNENRWNPHQNKSRKGKANQSKVNATTDRTDDTDDTDRRGLGPGVRFQCAIRNG